MTRYIAMLAVTLVPAVVSAQETAQSWPGLAAVEPSTVYVLDDTGVETSGRLLRLDPDSLVLLVGGTERRFEAARGCDQRERGRAGAVIAENDLRSMPSRSRKSARSVRTGMDKNQILRIH